MPTALWLRWPSCAALVSASPTSPNAKNVEALFDQTLRPILENEEKMLTQPLTEGQTKQSKQLLQQV